MKNKIDSTIDNKENNNQPKITKFIGKYYYGLGRRKSAIAQVRLYKGHGQVVINDKLITNKDEMSIYISPLELISKTANFDISVLVFGGGKRSWKDAIRLGVARALLELDKNLRPTLKKAGFLRRDPRVKERKKPGLKGARRAPQFSKR